MFARLALFTLLAFGASADAQTQSPSAAPSREALRTGVLVIPLDRASESRVLEFERQATRALKENGFQLAPPEVIFGAPRARPKRDEYALAREGFAAARDSFKAKDYEDTLARMGSIVEALRSAAPHLPGPKMLCEAYGLWGAAAFAVGSHNTAERALRGHLALCPDERLPVWASSPGLVALRTKLEQQVGPNDVLGDLAVTTRPPGARVVVDGQERGFAPLVLPGLRPGPHLLQVHRSGYEVQGRIVDLHQQDQEVVFTLRPTPRQERWEQEREALAGLILRNRSSNLFTRMGRTLGLGQGVIMTVRSNLDNGTVTVVLAHVRFHDGKILKHRRRTLESFELPPAGNELSRLVAQLVLPSYDDERPRRPRSKDPLDGVTGMEDW